jgi:hypothetical protein
MLCHTQQCVNDVLLQEGQDTAEPVRPGQPLVWLARRSVRVHALPVLVATNGHVAFVQGLPERYRGHHDMNLA